MKQATVKIKEALAALHRDSLKPEVFHSFPLSSNFHLHFNLMKSAQIFPHASGEQLRSSKCHKMLEVEVFYQLRYL